MFTLVLAPLHVTSARADDATGSTTTTTTETKSDAKTETKIEKKKDKKTDKKADKKSDSKKSATKGKKMTTGNTAIIKTTLGTITIKLFKDKAPKTVENFVSLATGAKEWTDPKSGEKMVASRFTTALFFTA